MSYQTIKQLGESLARATVFTSMLAMGSFIIYGGEAIYLRNAEPSAVVRNILNEGPVLYHRALHNLRRNAGGPTEFVPNRDMIPPLMELGGLATILMGLGLSVALKSPSGGLR